jgi:radical SAM/Cys-rich protein
MCPGTKTPADAELARAERVVEPFADTLAHHGLTLTRDNAEILQINVGSLCNMTCRHCHMEAGPERREIMDEATVAQVIEFAGRNAFRVVDITGGAPELNPHLVYMVESLAASAETLMVRSNLTNLGSGKRSHLIDLFKRHHVVIVASFPSASGSQLESQRGKGAFQESVSVLKSLNAVGYGLPGSPLRLDLVSNPTGAFLPVSQAQAEKKFKFDLERKWGITFNNLYTFANVPLGRFREWLVASGNYEHYMRKLASGFNPCTVAGLMCRTLVSVSWDGYLYDCDFNQAARIPAGGVKTHISEVQRPPASGTPIAISDHCYACTAGSGFT